MLHRYVFAFGGFAAIVFTGVLISGGYLSEEWGQMALASLLSSLGTGAATYYTGKKVGEQHVPEPRSGE